MILTPENYHSPEAKKLYSGSTEIKQFMECESKALAIINGEYSESKDAFLQGNFIDAHFDKTLDLFKSQHPEMFTKTEPKRLLAKFENITTAINAVESDPIMHRLWTGGKNQQIFTGEIEGLPIKIMVDSLLPDRAVDRKYMSNLEDKWSERLAQKVAWWKVYDYDFQAAIYNEILKQNGIDVPFDLCPITKETVPNKDWITFSAQTLELALDEVKAAIPRINALKSGLLNDANPCGECDYCKQQKKLLKPTEV